MEHSVNWAYDTIASYQPTNYLISGDLVEGRWGEPGDTSGVFGPQSDPATRIQNMADFYQGENVRRLKAAGLFDKLYAIPGDHDYGDNWWRVDDPTGYGKIKYDNFDLWRNAFYKYYLSNADGSPRFADRPVGTQWDKTAYATHDQPGHAARERRRVRPPRSGRRPQHRQRRQQGRRAGGRRAARLVQERPGRGARARLAGQVDRRAGPRPGAHAGAGVALVRHAPGRTDHRVLAGDAAVQGESLPRRRGARDHPAFAQRRHPDHDRRAARLHRPDDIRRGQRVRRPSRPRRLGLERPGGLTTQSAGLGRRVCRLRDPGEPQCLPTRPGRLDELRLHRLPADGGGHAVDRGGQHRRLRHRQPDRVRQPAPAAAGDRDRRDLAGQHRLADRGRGRRHRRSAMRSR